MTDGNQSPKYSLLRPHPYFALSAELIWEGKYDEYGRRRDVNFSGANFPLQRIETIDEPRSKAQAIDDQPTLFRLNEQAKKLGDFRNLLIWGDNKLVMSSLRSEFKGQVKLIYIDPPFDMGADFTMQVAIGDGDDVIDKDQSTLEMVAYRDMWGKGADSYLHMIYERVVLAHELLAANGAIYVHLGPNISHYVKLVMDEVFGIRNYRSEIIWRRSNAHNKTTDQYGPIHDCILFYSKSDDFTFHPDVRPFTRSYIESRFKYRDSRGVYQPNYLTGPGTRSGDSGKEWHGFDPTRAGRHWALPSRVVDLLAIDTTSMSTQQVLDHLLTADLLVIPKKPGGQPMYKQYITEGIPYQDLWTYQPNTRGVLYNSDESIDEDVKWLEQEQQKLGFATQKPEGLLQRIITTSSDPGDLVADFFCGSGTTIAVAEKSQRRWIGCDLGRFAVHTSYKRMIDLQRELHDTHRPYRAFDLCNLGRYERQWWQRERLRNADFEHRTVVLKFFGATEIVNPSSPLLHGRKGNAFVHVCTIDSTLGRESLREVVAAVHSTGGIELACLAWEFEMDLRLEVDRLRSQTGINTRLFRIPREIMERNRTTVPFFEVALLEAEAIYRFGAEDGLAADIRLTRFLPSLAEVPTRELEALKERASATGFDFIDFWAVDFNYCASLPFTITGKPTDSGPSVFYQSKVLNRFDIHRPAHTRLASRWSIRSVAIPRF